MHFVHPVFGTEEKLIIYHNILQTLNRDCTENIQKQYASSWHAFRECKENKNKNLHFLL